jgi:hypothetical protein
MTTKTLVWATIVIVIAALLGGASLIVATNGAGTGVAAPVGFLH